MAVLRGVDCVHVPVPDLDQGLAFYRDRLGHELIWRAGTAAGLRLRDSDTELVLEASRHAIEPDFLVDDVQEAVENVIAASGTVLMLETHSLRSMPSLILLPFHQDERLSELSIRLPAGTESVTVDPALPAADQWTRLAVLHDALATHVADSARTGLLTRVVTGDCLAALGTLAGLQRSGLDPALVWFDAHGDVHTVESSTSGYLGGMPLRMAVGGDPALLAGPLGLRALPERRAVLVDARDLDPAEATYLSQSDVRRTSVQDISARDLPSGPILLHVDLDVIDAGDITGLRFPVHNGPSAAQLFSAIESLLASGRVVALNIACPWFDPTGDAESLRRTELVGALLSLAEAA